MGFDERGRPRTAQTSCRRVQKAWNRGWRLHGVWYWGNFVLLILLPGCPQLWCSDCWCLDVFLLPPDLIFFPADYKWVEYSNDSVGYAILVYRKDIWRSKGHSCNPRLISGIPQQPFNYFSFNLKNRDARLRSVWNVVTLPLAAVTRGPKAERKPIVATYFSLAGTEID